jgi:hypothetical protein
MTHWYAFLLGVSCGVGGAFLLLVFVTSIRSREPRSQTIDPSRFRREDPPSF